MLEKKKKKYTLPIQRKLKRNRFKLSFKAHFSRAKCFQLEQKVLFIPFQKQYFVR